MTTRSNGYSDAHAFNGSPAESWGIHIEGAAAELAFALWRGLEWSEVAGDHHDVEGDVAHVQIRSTPYSNGRLIVHRTDPDDAPFVLLTGAAPSFTVRGWIWGRDAKRDQWWLEQFKRPAFFVPQDALRKIRQ